MKPFLLDPLSIHSVMLNFIFIISRQIYISLSEVALNPLHRIVFELFLS